MCGQQVLILQYTVSARHGINGKAILEVRPVSSFAGCVAAHACRQCLCPPPPCAARGHVAAQSATRRHAPQDGVRRAGGTVLALPVPALAGRTLQLKCTPMLDRVTSSAWHLLGICITCLRIIFCSCRRKSERWRKSQTACCSWSSGS